MTKNMTSGKPFKLILSFGLPLLFGYLFQQMYNIVDSAIVGRILGGSALAAVGSVGAVYFMAIGLCNGICGGLSIPVAQQFGAGNHRELRRYMAGGVRLTILFAIALTVSTLLLSDTILTVMNTPADIYQRSRWYITTIFAGLPAYFLYNFTGGVLRALGDSRTPVTCQIIGSLVNIVLDVVFILIFHLDVFGAALATVLSQYLAGFGCLLRMRRDFPILKTEKEDWAWNGRRMLYLCKMALPMGLQYSITGIGSAMLQASVNALGTIYVAAVAASSKISMFITCPFEAMGATMATYGGQNAGAAKWDRLKEGVRDCSILGLIYSILAFLVLYFFAEPMLMLFLDAESTAVLPHARRYLLSVAVFYFPLSLLNIFRFMVQGMGFAPLATLSGVMEMLTRVVTSYFVPVYGFVVVCFATPTAWFMAMAFVVPCFFYCFRQLKSRPIPE